MAVGKKDSDDPDIYSFSDRPSSRGRQLIYSLGVEIEHGSKTNAGKKLGRFFQQISRQPTHYFYKLLGIDDFNYPDTQDLLGEIIDKPLDVMNLHNLHSYYFDLRYLPVLSQKIPTIVTLHDAWLLSGHCAHSLNCEKWETGCGNCPYLGIDPPVMRDSTAYNWRQKKSIFELSRLYLISPSQWLMTKVQKSILKPAVRISKVIPNGIDLSIFKPMNRADARMRLNLPQEAFICLFVAVEAQKNSYKDYQMIQTVLKIVSDQRKGKSILFIALGGESENSSDDELDISHVAFIDRLEDVALYYQAADVYLHAAKAETFPNTVIESLACGTPVIATGVGGIPEQVEEGKTGFITPPGSASVMAERILQLLDSMQFRLIMSSNSAIEAKKRFGSEKMLSEYRSFYKDAIADWIELDGFGR